MAKRVKILPGPGAYTIDRDNMANVKHSFPKVCYLRQINSQSPKKEVKQDINELPGPGLYAIENTAQWSRHKNKVPVAFPKANRVVDVRKWGYKFPN